MTFKARARANRANAAKSTGPVTEAGKAASSGNATTHGLTSKKLVLNHEDQPKFEALRQGFLKSHNPANEFEIACVERITITYWRVERTSAVETALWDQLITTIDGDTPAESMATAFTDEAIAKKLKLFMRYQASITRDYNKALADLRHAQADRKARDKAAAQTPIAADSGLLQSHLDENGFVSQPVNKLNSPIENAGSEEWATLRGNYRLDMRGRAA